MLILRSLFLPIAAVTALQTIYLGTTYTTYRGSYIAFFSDSDPCNDGTVFGSTPNFQDCNKDLTILGHTNITFTGCTYDRAGFLPTGVSDLGAPALTCKPVSNPPQGYYATCYGSPTVGRYVSLTKYCE